MATHSINATRRQALGSIAAASLAFPAAARAQVPTVARDRTAWNAKMAEYRRAVVAANRIHDQFLAKVSIDDEEWDRKVGRASDLMHELLAMPAPDERALAFKLMVLLHRDNMLLVETSVAPARADVERFCGKPEAEYF